VSNYPKLHPDWVRMREELKNKPNWREDVLGRVRAVLGQWGGWADKIGSGINETEIDASTPINSLFSYQPLDLLYVQFNTHDPITKNDSTRVVRYGPNDAVLMVLVKVPDGDSFKWCLLVRRKYQFAGKDLFVEFSRGWVEKADQKDLGWKLFERDFPGLKDNPIVDSISEEMMGSPVYENNSDKSNKISHHLIIVTLKDSMECGDVQKLLVENKLIQDYPDENLGNLDPKALTSFPMVMELTEAAKLLNNHLSGKEEKLALFGENFSVNCWSRFLSLHGRQFPELLPESVELI